ncbi:MAG: hypothetical protein ACRCUP_08130 [Mycoplasmatales bacterium]
MSTKIYFNHGCMNSGKSLELIKVAYNYRENGIECLVLKPEIDTRSIGKIFSRTGLTLNAIDLPTDEPQKIRQILEREIGDKKIILVEEGNFFSSEAIDEIVSFSYENMLQSLIFFGLKVDFRGNLFEGTKRIIERADKIIESTSICWCGKKARQNGRVVDDKLTKDGPTILIDDDHRKVEYVALCNYHYSMGLLKPKESLNDKE